MKLKLYFLILTLCLLNGCASSGEGGDYFQAPANQPSTGITNLYIYNPYEKPDDNPFIYIDKQKVVMLPNSSYTLLQVSPGNHTLGIQKNKNDKVKTIKSIYLKPNKNYYLEYTRYIASIPFYQMIMYVTDQNFILIDSYEKASNITICKFVKPFVAKI